MKKTIILLLIMVVLSNLIKAVEAQNITILESKSKRTGILEKELLIQKRFKLSGYIQTQFQYGEKYAQLKIGGKNANTESFYNRFGIRRGRTKLEFKSGDLSTQFQVDITEKGVEVKDAFFTINNNLNGICSLKIGVFNRPFGYEVSFSSSVRESPERAMVITTLFPEERDLGVSATLQAPLNSKWHFFKLEVGVISGNGIKKDMDSYKDVIGRLSFKEKIINDIDISGGISYYKGCVYQGSSTLYKMKDNFFVKDSKPTNLNVFAKREYFGSDFQFSIKSLLGITNLFGEYIFGMQLGDINSSKSPNYSILPTKDIYIREFIGYYLTLAQNLINNSLSLVVKYDYYDPNTRIAKDDVGLNNSGSGDISYATLGCGVLWTVSNQLRGTFYYDWIVNETSSNLMGYEKELADNMFTFRLQYKF